MEVWQCGYGSFHKVAQYNHAIRLIRMPIWAFYKLSEEVGDPPAKIIFAEFVPRSGSTLMCRPAVRSHREMCRLLRAECYHVLQDRQRFRQ
jgi:hypothetical protein